MSHAAGYVVVFFGAGLGGVLRHAVNRLLMTGATTIPWSTAIVNISGSLAMGVVAGWFAFRSGAAGQTLPLFLTTGVLGGYTTFSAFSLDVVLLWERGQTLQALTYAGGSVLLSIVGLVAGMALLRP